MLGIRDYTPDFTNMVFQRWYLFLLAVGGVLAGWLLSGIAISPTQLTAVGVSYLYLYIFLLLNEVTVRKTIDAAFMHTLPLVMTYLTFGIGITLVVFVLGQAIAEIYVLLFVRHRGHPSLFHRRQVLLQKAMYDVPSLLIGLFSGLVCYMLLTRMTEIPELTAWLVLALVTAGGRTLVINLMYCRVREGCTTQQRLLQIAWRFGLDGIMATLGLLLPHAVVRGNAIMFGCIFAIFLMLMLGVRAIRVVYLALTDKVKELEVLDQLSKTLLTVSTRDEMYQVTYELVAQLMTVPVFYVADPILPLDWHVTEREADNPLGINFPFVMDNGQQVAWADQPWEPDSRLVQTMQHGSQLFEASPATPATALPVVYQSHLSVPILYQDAPPGVIGVLHPTARGFYRANDRRILETIAAQIAIVARANRLRLQTQHFTDGLIAVNQVSNVINASLEQTTILEETCASAKTLAQADSAVIFLKANTGQHFAPVHNMGLTEGTLQALENSITVHYDNWMRWLSRLGTKAIPDFATDGQAPWLAPIMAEAGLDALILTPFIAMRSLLEGDTLYPARDLLGFQLVFFSEPHIPQGNTLNLLQMLANQSAIALENVGLFGETQHTLDRLVYLEESTRVFTESLALGPTTQAIVEWFVMALDLDSATLALGDAAEAALVVQAHAHKSINEAVDQPVPAFGQPLAQLPEVTLTLRNRWSQLYTAGSPGISPALQAIMDDMQFTTLLLTPLKLRNDVMGLLALGRHDDQPITANDINVAEAIASQAAAAIQNAQYYAFTETELTARVTEMSVLETVLRNISASADEQMIIKDVLKAAAIVTRANLMSCALRRPSNILHLYWYTDDSPEQIIQQDYPDSNRGVVGLVLRNGRSQIIDDTRKITHYWTPSEFHAEYRSELCVPIMHQGTALGVLNIENFQPAYFNLSHQRFMQNLAGHAAIALVRAELLANNRRQITILDTIRSLSLDLLDTIELKATLHKVCHVALNIVNALNVQVYFYDEATDTVSFFTGLSNDGRRDIEVRPPRPDGLTYQAIRAEKPVLSDTFIQIPGIPTRRLGIFPLKHQGRVIGTLNVGVANPAYLDRDEIRALELLTNQTASAVARSRLFIERQHQSELSDKLRQISVAMLNAINMADLLQIICDGALALVEANEVHLYFYNPATEKLSFAANLWRDGTRNQEVPLNPGGITVSTVEAGEIILQDSKNYPPSRPGLDIKITAGIPLKYSTELLGVISMSAADAACFGDAELQALELFANQSAPAIINMWYTEEIRDGRDQMQVVLNTVRDALVMIDQNGSVLQANPAADRLLGMNITRYQGEHLLQILHRHAKAQNLSEDDFRHPLNIKGFWRGLEDDIYQITRRSVERATPTGMICLEEESAPVLAENGDPVGRLFVWHDVTEARQMADARDELTNTIIHDLRSPLASIKSALHMLPEMLVEPESLHQSTQVVAMAENSADGLLDLVAGLLDVARLESGKVPLNQFPTEFNFPLTEALQTLHVLAQDQSVDLHTDIPKNLPPVNIDAEKIRRVLINLVDNALHYTPAGGRVLIMADEAPDSNFLLVTVDDSGPGIPPDKRDEIFDRFITGITGGTTKHKGLGLGLAFCKLAVEAHGGTIWVEDGLSGGAAFRFTLPIVS